MIIIYLTFFFSGHWCAGAMQIKDSQITYWNDGKYVTETIVRKDQNGSDTIIKTESKVILISKSKVQYFVDNKKVTLWKKKL
jgi:hypothetical protein